MRGVERQTQMHRATAGGDVRTETLVVFHVPAGQFFGCGMVELGKQIARHLAQRIHQHIQTTPVRHANHDFLDALDAGRLNQLIHAGDKTLAAFQGKALLPHVLGVQKPLQAFGRGQPIQNVFLLFHREARFGTNTLQLLLPPAFVVLIRGVHELRTDGAAISLPQRVHQLAQAHAVFAKEGVAGVKHRFLVGIAETVKRGLQFRNRHPLGALQRVQIRPTDANVAVGCNQLLRGGALAPHFGIDIGHHHLGATLFGTLSKCIDDGQVRHVFGVAAIGGGHMLQGVEVITPTVWHTTGVGQVVFVHLFDVRCVATKKIGIGLIGLIDRRCRTRPLRRCFTHIALTSVSLQET